MTEDWLRRESLRTDERRGAWWGVAIVALALGAYVVGQFAAMHAVVQVSFWLAVVGLIVCVVGLSGLSLLTFPLLYLLAAIPIPEFLHYELSSWLQLLSSALGIGCLQLIGSTISVKGNPTLAPNCKAMGAQPATIANYNDVRLVQ